MSDNPLDTQFTARTKDYLVGIDSDGCAFDTMELKHKECFIPNIIKFFGLQACSKYGRECAEFVNLYSKERGINRFPALLSVLDYLAERPEVRRRGVKLPELKGLRDWVARETRLGNPTLIAEVEAHGDPDLTHCLRWSEQVNLDIDAMVHGVSPYPMVRESLEKLDPVADKIVCSATPNAALQKEWEEHDIAKYVEAICGQEAGGKKETLGQAAAYGYEKGKVLMMGDAPGDLKAARAVGALFYPINPGHEEESWERFHGEGCDRFLNGEYAGEYEAELIAEFQAHLPEDPTWPRVEG
ncbi:HAD family hydrolase [Alienimonas sp. DA493]|uniref:HAD family hydrolase n=1 Tax=Alienimonas sp. DA493 TaxID=3373605 RepID=UPI0037544117